MEPMVCIKNYIFHYFYQQYLVLLTMVPCNSMCQHSAAFSNVHPLHFLALPSAFNSLSHVLRALLFLPLGAPATSHVLLT